MAGGHARPEWLLWIFQVMLAGKAAVSNRFAALPDAGDTRQLNMPGVAARPRSAQSRFARERESFPNKRINLIPNKLNNRKD
jgi:hypothetical protein